jgi:transcriptional regulator with XRE-family HTH domain
MASKYWNKVSKSIAPSSKLFAKKSLDIIDQIHHILEQKGMTQKELAQTLDKSESEISKWLSGGHNITLKTITRIEAALNATVITTPLRENGYSANYVYASYETEAKIISINNNTEDSQTYSRRDYKIQID